MIPCAWSTRSVTSSLERGERNADGVLQFIVTLEAGTGFSASFAASEDLLASIARSVVEDVFDIPANASGERLNS
jgi:hypothetical protein